MYHPCWPSGEASKREHWWLTRTLVDVIDSTVIPVSRSRPCRCVEPWLIAVCLRQNHELVPDQVASTAQYQNHVSEPANTRGEVR